MINNQLSCTNTNEINEDYEQYLTDIRFMKEAYNLALKADKKNETPIGCVIVHNNKIIAKGYNRRNTDNCTIKHAEISAIVAASKVLKDWRLEDCTLYVTLEPCQMCAGAIVQARIPRVVIGAMSAKSGCAGWFSSFALFNNTFLYFFSNLIFLKNELISSEHSFSRTL